jgi:hypothetical protein
MRKRQATDRCISCRELVDDCACPVQDAPVSDDPQAGAEPVHPVWGHPPADPPSGLLPPAAPTPRLVVVSAEYCSRCNREHDVYGYQPAPLRARAATTPPPSTSDPGWPRERPPTDPTASLYRAMDPIS